MGDMTGPLISVPRLTGLLGAVTLLDVRYRLGGPPGREEYAAGHVPGAVYVDMDADLAAPAGEGGRHPLPHAGVFEAAMRRAGVSGNRPVVVYDDWSGLAAGRAWWLLRHHGHPDVRVLAGGWGAWRRGGGEVETGGPAQAAHGDFVADPGHLHVVEAEAVMAVPVLVDARAP